MSTQCELIADGVVARLVFSNSGGLNLLDAGCRQTLADALTKLEQSAAFRVVVVEARGKVFLAGADLKELAALDAASALAYAEAGQMLLNRLADLPQPTVAVLHGVCAGGGCELALACNFRLLAREARIGLPETSLGLLPGWGGTVRAVAHLGLARAESLILSGQLLPADAALALGLVHQVCDASELPAATSTLVSTLLTRGPQALSATKHLLHSHSLPHRSAQLAAEAHRFAACYASGEATAGIAAFLAKTPAPWCV